MPGNRKECWTHRTVGVRENEPPYFESFVFRVSWVSVVWYALIGAPILIMTWSLCASTVEGCLARWSGGMMMYAPLVLSLLVAVVAGLLIAVAPFPDVVIP